MSTLTTTTTSSTPRAPLPLNQLELAKLGAESKLKDSFDDKSLAVLRFYSEDVIPYLLDYLILVDDLTYRLSAGGETLRRAYSDYSFLLLPVHKAYESYLTKLLSFNFGLSVSKKTGQSVGSYLKAPNVKKNKVSELAKKIPWKISVNKWEDRWDGLKTQWGTNRNPLIHPEEKLDTIRKAEDIARGIFREMNVSAKLFAEELLDPLLEIARKQKK